MNAVRIGIAGCSGRMGQMLVREVLATDGAVLAGGSERADSEAVGKDLGILAGGAALGAVVHGDPAALFAAVDVVIDFTAPAASVAHARLAAETKRALVIGTTGLSDADHAALRLDDLTPTIVRLLRESGERTITMSAALDRTEHVVLPPLIARRVVSKPPGAELLSNGEVIGETPVEIELPQSDDAEPFTLRLTGYLEQTIEIVPNRPGTTTVALEREPQNVVHELTCDPECEVVLDHEVVGRAAPGTAYRVEFLELKGQWRTYVLRPLEKRYRETSFRAPADRSVKTTIRLPCAPRARPTASADPRVYDPYDACRDR
jgi:hypothetical protein